MRAYIIDIPAQAIRAPTRFDLARVGAAMLFPDDEKKRLAYEEADALLAVCELRHLPEILQWPVREITAAAASRFAHGVLAGYVLHEVLGRPRLGLCESGKAEIVGGLISDLKFDPKKSFARLSSKTFANATWSLFRPVAHFWAATFVAIELEREPFPCALASVKNYFALVEAFRIAGETTKAKQSPEPFLLRPDETVKLPANLAIRPAALEFSPR
jgi:hypothetical protein